MVATATGRLPFCEDILTKLFEMGEKLEETYVEKGPIVTAFYVELDADVKFLRAMLRDCDRKPGPGPKTHHDQKLEKLVAQVAAMNLDLIELQIKAVKKELSSMPELKIYVCPTMVSNPYTAQYYLLPILELSDCFEIEVYPWFLGETTVEASRDF